MVRRPWAGVIAALIVVALAVGIGWRVYDVGYDHGVTAGVQQAATSSTVVVHDDYGHGHGFFPFFFLFPLGFFFLFFFILRPLMWGRRGGWGPGGGMRGGLEEWHRRQHQQENEPKS
jgi:hypothetical protein